MATVSDHAIEVRRLRKSYGGIERLHGVSFSVDHGEVFGFLGTNGAGKTTTIEILEGYRARDGGEVRVLGADPAHAGRDWRNRIGLVLQESELNPVYTVRETVAMFARYFSQPTDLDATIASAGLADKAGERVGRLSGGDLTALLGWAAEHGVELTDIRVSPPTLDDVFVQLAVPAGQAQDDGS